MMKLLFQQKDGISFKEFKKMMTNLLFTFTALLTEKGCSLHATAHALNLFEYLLVINHSD